MRFAVKILAAGAVLSMLAACGTIDAEKVADMENKGDAFAGHLRDGYVEIGGWEAAKDDYDWSDSDRHYNKAISAANGELVLPEEISSRKLPDTHVAELTAARQRLLNSLDATARQKIPDQAARAQVMFDCWMEEQEENFEDKDIARCKNGFEAAMAKVEAAMAPAMAKPKPKPAPPPAPIVDGLYLVFFDWDDDRPNTESGKVLLKILEDYKVGKPIIVRLTGHADRSGSDEYNFDLSRRRAENIKALLSDGGIASNKMAVNFAGESRPLRPTADGVRELRNRRVEIEFE